MCCDSAEQTETAVSVLFSEPKIPQPTPSAQQRQSLRRFSALQRAENSSKRSETPPTPGLVVSVLFSEPKIPQLAVEQQKIQRGVFQCSSASRKFLNDFLRVAGVVLPGFSALQRAENSSTFDPQRRLDRPLAVSVLFSEPKIPQCDRCSEKVVGWRFQCSSASRKFLNAGANGVDLMALPFQCSSASRKFLNVSGVGRVRFCECFSALQRAENSSTGLFSISPYRSRVSVLFSEPKIPQARDADRLLPHLGVSVLFSEPKIPQPIRRRRLPSAYGAFQCSSASRKFLNDQHRQQRRRNDAFQCSSASRKFLKLL